MNTNSSGFIDQNDRIMAALAHITAVIPMMGMIAPIIIWATQKDKSEYVAFQSLQAIIYQLSIILAWLLGMGCYMAAFFGMFILIPLSDSFSNSVPMDIFGVFLPFLVMLVMMFGGIAYVIYGVVAAVMTFQGKNFRYVVIGNRLEKYLSEGKTENEKAIP